jgi:tetratricopeptide (TPR) repeat protein
VTQGHPQRRSTVPGLLILIAIAAFILLSSTLLIYQLLVNNNRITSLLILPPTVEAPEPDSWLAAQAAADSFAIRLMHVPNLRVSGRETALAAARQPTARDAAIEAGVIGVLHGRVTRKNSRYQLEWTLTDARDGKVRGQWNYQGDSPNAVMAHWLTAQVDFTRVMLETIKADRDAEIMKRVQQKLSPSLRAWIEYERGQNLGFAESIGALQTAQMFDLEFGLAYAALANRQMDLGERIPDGRADIVAAGYMVEKAEQYSPQLGPVKSAKGRLLALSFQMDAARKAFEESIRLAPGHHAAHEWFAKYYWVPLGRPKQAAGAAKRGSDLNPLSASTRTTLVYPFIATRQYDEAKTALDAALKLDPTYRPAMRLAALLPVWQTLAPRPEPYVTLSNKRVRPPLTADQARARLESMLESLREGPRVTAIEYASILGGLRQTEDALYVLEQGWDRKDASLLWTTFDPGVSSLLQEPRMRKLCQQLGLSER